MSGSTYWPDFNDLWNYADPAGTEAKFLDILHAIAESDDSAYHLQLLTQIARTHSLRSNFEKAHHILDEVEAGMAGNDIVEVRYLLERGRSFNSAGRPEQAVPLFKRAAQIGEEIGAAYYWVDALHMLGIAAPVSERMGWHLKGLEVAKNSPDERTRGWIGGILNNIGWAYFAEEDYQNALKAFEQTELFYKDRVGQLEYFQIARWSTAKTLRMLGRIEEALVILRELETAGKKDGFTEEEIAESLFAIGKSNEAKPYFKAAYDKLSHISWVAEDTARLERLNTLGR